MSTTVHNDSHAFETSRRGNVHWGARNTYVLRRTDAGWVIEVEASNHGDETSYNKKSSDHLQPEQEEDPKIEGAFRMLKI